MSLSRLAGIQPGRFGVFAGPLNALPSAVQRNFAQEMERLGYGTLWYGESTAMEAFARGAMLLAATRQLVIASGIANIWARDAMAMAAGGRTLNDAWPGRFILGIGVSHPSSVRGRGHDYERPYSTMKAYLDAMAGAQWRGPNVDMPPVVLAALGPRMTALAGERTAGAYPYFTTDDHVREVRGGLGPEAFLAADLPIVVAETREAARAAGGDRHLTSYLRSDDYPNNLARLGWPAEELEAPGSDRLFDAIVAWGDTDRLKTRIEERFAAGADQVVFNLISAETGRPPTAELAQIASIVRQLS